MKVFDQIESEVQSYARLFPQVFHKAKMEFIYDLEGNRYLDFFAGAGAVNYGHNNPVLKERLLEYISADGIANGLDLYTKAKAEFLEVFDERILQPRNMRYVAQFTGPTGTNAVEAALKLARKVTGRENIIAFTNSFHGVTLGSLAVTGNSYHRGAAGTTMYGVCRMPYDGYLGDDIDTTSYIDKLLCDAGSGVDKPAAVIVETVQGEGGINAASFQWLGKLEGVCRKHEMLLIVDDIQAGCGRTGTFFSFEGAGISPDIVTMSKSLSGYGLPLSMVLLKPEIDRWKPGEHNGTFRGNNLAFVTAKAAIEHYWTDDEFETELRRKGAYISQLVEGIVQRFATQDISGIGRGTFRGINCNSGGVARKIIHKAFRHGLIIETSGANNQVLKLMCPLVITDANLKKGIDILERAMEEVLFTSEVE